MSTQFTISRGENFHFYSEALDADNVYLSLDTMQYMCWHGRVLVAIPVQIWETIRHLGGVRLELADKTDAELRTLVESDVDKRIAAFEAAKRNGSPQADSMRLVGGIVYGAADTPRAEQIQRGVEYFHKERQRQSRLKASVAALRGAPAANN